MVIVLAGCVRVGEVIMHDHFPTIAGPARALGVGRRRRSLTGPHIADRVETPRIRKRPRGLRNDARSRVRRAFEAAGIVPAFHRQRGKGFMHACMTLELAGHR